MIVGVGCDLVEHRITEQLGWESDEGLLNRIFSSEELDLYHTKKKVDFLSGRFAAKEAVLKCLGTGMQDGISLTDIHVLQSNMGQPKIELSGEPKKISDKMGIFLWHVSISHSTSHSLAFVVAEG
jgi:holo-[acyl-carrier protein] synthase